MSSSSSSDSGSERSNVNGILTSILDSALSTSEIQALQLNHSKALSLISQEHGEETESSYSKTWKKLIDSLVHSKRGTFHYRVELHWLINSLKEKADKAYERRK